MDKALEAALVAVGYLLLSDVAYQFLFQTFPAWTPQTLKYASAALVAFVWYKVRKRKS